MEEKPTLSPRSYLSKAHYSPRARGCRPHALPLTPQPPQLAFGGFSGPPGWAESLPLDGGLEGQRSGRTKTAGGVLDESRGFSKVTPPRPLSKKPAGASPVGGHEPPSLPEENSQVAAEAAVAGDLLQPAPQDLHQLHLGGRPRPFRRAAQAQCAAATAPSAETRARGSPAVWRCGASAPARGWNSPSGLRRTCWFSWEAWHGLSAQGKLEPG